MTPRTFILIRRYHQRALWTRSLWIMTGALVLDIFLARSGVELRPRLYGLGAGVLIALLLRVWPRRTLRETATALDGRMKANNRLEAVIELEGRGDPMAAAARAEAELFLKRRPLPRSYGWIAGMTLFGAALLATVATFDWRSARPRASELASAPATALVETPAPAEPLRPLEIASAPGATLRWILPDEETTAAAKDEIPLVAQAASTTGLRGLTLHVAVNGEERAPISVPETVLPAEQRVDLALSLETFELQPYDVVTYHLRAERIRPSTILAEPVWPGISSPLQLVQIRASEHEPIANLDSSDPASGMLLEILQMKHDQFVVTRDAFALAQLAREGNTINSTARRSATAAEQNSLVEKLTAQVSAAVSLSPEAAISLNEAKAEASKAARELAAGNLAAAVAPATRARARLAAAEKVATRLVMETRARLAAEAAARGTPDPAVGSDELSPRETTPAGRLGKLATEQKAIADQLAARTPAAGIFQEQDRVARAIGKLAAEISFSDQINALIKSAVLAATEAATQLNEQDPEAAVEPATRAAQALGEAVEKLNEAGENQATEDLLIAQQSLLHAATDLDLASDDELAALAFAGAARASEVQQMLRAAAQRQQQQGSAGAAQKLNDVAKAVAESKVSKALADLANSGARPSEAKKKAQKDDAVKKLTELANGAANSAGDSENGKKEQARAEEELRRIQASLARIAARSDRPSPLRWLNPPLEVATDPNEKMPLVIEASSATGFTGLVLSIAVNGTPRAPVAVDAVVRRGVQEVPISLLLEPLKLKFSDYVSYYLTAVPIAAASGKERQPPEKVSSAVQVIVVSASSSSPADPTGGTNSAGGSGGEQTERDGPEVVELVQRLEGAQRGIVERTMALEKGNSSRKDVAWRETARSIAAEQRKNEQVTALLIEDRKTVNTERTFNYLREARSEMQKTIAALEEGESSAVNPAVRALAALLKILNQSSGQSRGGGSGKNGNGSGTSTAGYDLGGTGAPSNATTALYRRAAVQIQRLRMPPSSDRTLPPPGSGSTGQELHHYANLLSERISGLVELADETRKETKRAQVLTTASPSDAPPVYRSAVADYFEKLARERPQPATRKP